MSKSLADNPFITEAKDKNGDSWYHQIILEKKEEEIERLQEDIGNYVNIVLHDRKEIDRLNNIINELERYINEEYIYDELGMKIFDASKLQDKLQELKGSDKE